MKKPEVENLVPMPSYVNHVLNLLIAKTKVEINVQHIPVYHNVQKGNNTQACTHDE
jgi:hypothetical protein